MRIETCQIVYLTDEEYHTLDKACDIIDNIVNHLDCDRSGQRGRYEELLENLFAVLYNVKVDNKN